MEKQKLQGRRVDSRVIDEATRLNLVLRPNQTIRPGDRYLAVRRRPRATLLECARIENDVVVPTDESEYRFLVSECVKVEGRE